VSFENELVPLNGRIVEAELLTGIWQHQHTDLRPCFLNLSWENKTERQRKTITFFDVDFVLLTQAATSQQYYNEYTTPEMQLNYSVWVNKNPHRPKNFWHFFQNGREFLVQISHAYCMFLSTLDYKFLFSYLQLWRSYTILNATTTICSKCPPSVGPHAGWSHLIWHNNDNIIIVGDNLIIICNLA